MKTSQVVVAVVLASTVFLSTGLAQQKSSNKKMVERGKWLVNLGGCNDCHSPKKFGPMGPVPDETKLLSGAPGQNPVPEIPKDVTGMDPNKWGGFFSGDLTTWAGPWGVSFARNLTPDIATGLGSWTDAMFIKTLRLGKHMGEGRQLLPPMPWEGIGKLNDADLKAMFAYLKSLPPIENAVPDPISPSGEKIPTPVK